MTPRGRPSPDEPAAAALAPHLGPVVDEGRRDHDRFEAAELGVVLSHYDLGVIARIRTFPRGSRRAPKVRISAADGEFLLKRRAPGRDDPQRVAFAHDLQRLLAHHGFPVPELLPARSDGSTMLQVGPRIYEMFRFVAGERDDRTPTAARTAGSALGLLHRTLADHRPAYTPPSGTYHAAAGLDGALRTVPRMVAATEPACSQSDIERQCGYLGEVYRDAARRAEAAGLGDAEPRVIHGDWHPGNLLYRNGEIAAVLDFDSARMAPRLLDVANAALQFSMIITDPEDPERWPVRLDVKRIEALLTGYDHAAEAPVGLEQRKAIPWLILEALIMESIVPIAAEGRFGPLSGRAFLNMVERKVRWLKPRATKLSEYLR